MMKTDLRRGFRIPRSKAAGRPVLAFVGAAALFVAPRPSNALIITPTFTAAFNSNFGVNAIAAQNAWIAAANVFQTNFNDNIHINITVDAVAGTGVFGQSQTFIGSLPFAILRSSVIADATTPDDATSTGVGGSIPAADPVGGTHTWWVTKAQAKALGLTADDLTNDGITRFGAGNPFTFSGPIAPGTFDFQGVAAHEITEVMGRLGLMGVTIGTATNSYDLADLFVFSGAGTRGGRFGGGCSSTNDFFSIDNGTTLLKQTNNFCSNGLDVVDWAPGSNDAFNQFSNSGVVNGVSVVDLRFMDVLGYNRVLATTVPEPSTLALLASGFAALAASGYRRRRKRRS
jgi:hypothetical protein